MRRSRIERNTSETNILVDLSLDGEGKSEINTGIGFMDHMLTLAAFHGGFDLNIDCDGDLKVDDHHTIEDLGIALGQAFRKALGDMKGINRYSSIYIPMDEALCRVVVDMSNRPYLLFDVEFSDNRIGEISTQNFKEFFKAFVNEARITLHISVLYGENDHHKIEAVFKGFSRALKEASRLSPYSANDKIPSTKGVL